MSADEVWECMLKDAFTPLHQIMDGLFLGNRSAAQDSSLLDNKGFFFSNFSNFLVV